MKGWARQYSIGPVKLEAGWYPYNAWRLLWFELLVNYDHGSFCIFDIEFLKFCLGVYVDRKERT